MLSTIGDALQSNWTDGPWYHTGSYCLVSLSQKITIVPPNMNTIVCALGLVSCDVRPQLCFSSTLAISTHVR
jgi:hypothetical protein